MQKLKNGSWLFALIVTCVVAISCKKTFDEPALTGPAGVVANTTIAQLKEPDTIRYRPRAITDDIIITGIVGMDDRSGNYYQQIAIQDETGGILLRLAGSNLFTSYPVGRRVYVKMKGLYIGDYGGVLQIGGGIDPDGTGVTLLAPNLQDAHILKGAMEGAPAPKVVTFSQLTTKMSDPHISTLIQLQNVEFASTELNKTYADATASGNRFVQGCTSPTSNRITLRTSNFANFATLPVAQGNGSITGIYSIFSTTKQLTIRDTTDVNMYGPRCAGSGPISGTGITLTTSPYLINFDNIGTALPTGVFVSSNASATSLGSSATYTSAKGSWVATGAGFKNFASATGLAAGASLTDQDNSTNRALGVRQTSTADIGGDPGAAFIFLLENTTGKSNLKLEFNLQSLDAGSGRTTTWRVDYATGTNPTSFTAATATGTLTTGGNTFSNNLINVDLPAALNNLNTKVWIRIVAITPTTGGGNRASTAIDDVKISFN